MTSLLLLKFGRYLIIPAVILLVMTAIGFLGHRWGKAGYEVAYVEAQLDLGRKICRADERIGRESPSQESVDTILNRLERYAVDRPF
jgi:hypothetical protein